jgi:hypothetical protein
MLRLSVLVSLAVLLPSLALAQGAPVVTSRQPGTVKGTVEYARGQFFLKSGRETVCIMGSDDDPAVEGYLEAMIGREISLSGPVVLFSTGNRCIVAERSALPAPAAASTGAALPGCTSPVALQTMEGAIKNMGLKVQKISSPQAISDAREVDPDVRFCRANALTDRGLFNAFYDIHWKARATGAWYVEVTLR